MTDEHAEVRPPLAPQHGALQRLGGKPALRLVELPPWHGWSYRSEAARARRWIESQLVIPTGAGAGSPLRLAGFQRRLLDVVYSSLATFCSVPTANGKTTMLAAVALERICRGDDYAEVDVIATKEDQAAILVEAAKRMVECCAVLVPLCSWHSKEGILEYRPTGSVLSAHPAKLSALQGLNFSLAIVDEVGFANDDLVEALLARLGKRPDARLVGIGTPGFDPNVLARIRNEANDGALPVGVRYVEHSAPPGCDLWDRRAWRTANPALAAGFLAPAALELQAGALPERAFRTYHLGQWVDQASGWLPVGAWDDCPDASPPADGTDVVIAVEGTYRRSVAVCGAGLDGATFYGWSAETPTDAQVRDVVESACSQWNVVEVVYPKRIRPNLFAQLARDGFPVAAWSAAADVEAQSANELYRAILDRRLAHDHDEMVAAHFANMAVRWGVDGSLRLCRPDDGRPVDCALAVRAAWWRASQLAAFPPPEPDLPAVF